MSQVKETAEMRMEREHRNASPSCWDCETSHKYSGSYGGMYEPPEPPYVECTNDEVISESNPYYDTFEEIGWDEDKMPNLCRRYKPLKVGPCCHCKTVIEDNLYNWPYWVLTLNEPVPVCGPQCRDELMVIVQKEFDDLEKEMKYNSGGGVDL